MNSSKNFEKFCGGQFWVSVNTAKRNSRVSSCQQKTHSKHTLVNSTGAPTNSSSQEIMGGRGLGATEHTRGRPAVILCNAPMGNESPIHRQCDQLHPERENEVWQVKQELELE